MTSVFKVICLLALVLLGQSADPLVFCPSTTVQKRNVVVETPVTLPPAMTYEYSSTQGWGQLVTQLTARVEGKKLFLSVLYKDFNIVQQTKTYDTPIQIVDMINQVVLIKVYSADKSTFSYTTIVYNNGATSSPQVALDQNPLFTMTKDAGGNSLVGFQIKYIVSLLHSTLNMYAVVASSTEAYIYSIYAWDGTMTRIGKIQSPSLPKILGGSDKLIFDDVSDKFYVLSGGNFKEYDIGTNVLSGKMWVPSNVQVQAAELSYAGYLSTEVATKKGTFLFDKGIGIPEIYQVGGGAIMPKMYGDQYLNLVVWSDKALIWWSLGVTFRQSITHYSFNKKLGEGADSIIAEFSTALTINTNTQNAFVLTATGIKFFQISKPAADAVITKIQQTILPDTVLSSISGAPGKQIALTFKCQCATSTAPKLICFSTSLNCLMVTNKQFSDCTTMP